LNLRLIVALVAMTGLLYAPLTIAQPTQNARTEIDYLLDFVEISGCEFYRNGSWYDSVRAQEHLRQKYEYLLGRADIVTAEDFIAQVGSESSLTGIPYQIRCGGECTEVTTTEWLLGVLARYRIVALRESLPP
jgi:hypothetical protein